MATPQINKRDPLKGQKTLKVSGFLEEFEKDDIKKNVDIVELFQSFGTTLTLKGKNYMGLCPWHAEKTPSLSVDREKGLYNCFGCGESGDAFSLVEKIKGTDFKGALKFLKERKTGIVPVIVPLTSNPVKPVEPELVKPEPTLEVKTSSLNAVLNYYHKRLYDNPKALEYLKSRGLTNPANYERFQTGFADGSLHLVTGEKQRQELAEAGIFNDKGLEHFKNCLVFPILDEQEQVVGLYGRDINDESTFKHRYLKGNHKGVFNRKASRVYDEIILTESMIDALSLIETGIENVQPIYGTQGFTTDHLNTLKADRVKTVILALDNDPAGQKAVEKYRELLMLEGFQVKEIYPNSKDWNEDLIKDLLNKEELKAKIAQAPFYGLTEEPTGFKAKEDKGQYFFNCLDMTYRLTGVKEVFANSLKVTIKAGLTTTTDDFFIDTVDLYLYRSRSHFAAHVASHFNIEARRVERDLLNILEYLEKQRDLRLEKDKPTVAEMTEEEKQAGLELLRNLNLLDEVSKDLQVLGYVGEDMNKKLLYLCATSRKMDNPISVMIVSESASGKSYLVDTVKKLIPEEELHDITSLSDQALNYMENLVNKFLVFGESMFNETIEHLIREMLSSKQLSRYVTIKDEKTGELVTKQFRKEVIVASVMSTTNRDMNPENASRYFLINADESKEQTRRIFEAQRQKYSLERHYAKAEQIPAIIARHKAAQRLLRNVFIVNPLAPFLEFPDGLMRLRRDHDRFIDLMAVICFLRQYQKVVKTTVVNGAPLEYIECDDYDYTTAREFVAGGMLSATLDELPKAVKRLYEELRAILKQKAEDAGLKATEAEIQQREIRRHIDWLSVDQIKRHLRVLVRYEYITLRMGANRGQRFAYGLAVDEPIDNIDISMIPTIEEIHKKMKGAKAGQSGAKKQ